MSFITGPIPEHIRKLMPAETRKELRAPTSAEAQAKLDGKREKELQENIASLLRQRNIWFERKRMDKPATGTVGCPDFLFAVFGRPVAFECKMPGEQLTKEQNDALNAMMANGWSFRIIESEAEAVAALNQLEEGNQ